MAVRAADALAGNDVTLVVSSPMERAQQTSAPIAERHELPIEIDPDLIEADNIFEGKRVSVGDGVLKQPKTWRHLYNPFRPSWGEPYDEVAERMHSGDRRRPGRRHAGTRPSSSATSCRSGSRGSRPRSVGSWHDPRSRQCSLASLTSLTYDGDTLAAITYTEPSRDLLAKASKVAGA